MQSFRSQLQREEIETEAVRLLILLEENPSDDNRKMVDLWLAQDPYHAVAFSIARSTWARGAQLRDATATNALQVDPSAQSEPASLAPTASDGPGTRSVWSRRRVVGGLAAGIAAAVGIPVAYGLLTSEKYRTARGERSVARLADGSAITLNTDTELDIKLGRSTRSVNLVRGEAMFDVAHDKERPFLVDIGQARIKVLGTKFNVRKKKDVVELSVSEGLVSVSASEGDLIKVPAGASAVIRPGGQTTLITAPELVEQHTAWTSGYLDFQNESLEAVISEFNRYRAHPIVIGDPRVSSFAISGRFGLNEGDAFIAIAKDTFDIDAIEQSDGTVVLLLKGVTQPG